MSNIQNLYSRAGMVLYISAALHVLAITVSGGALFSQLIVATILWTVIGYFLSKRGWRWLAYVGFIGMLVEIIASVTVATGNSGLTRITMFSITIADVVVAVLLLVALWREPQTA